MRREEHEAYAAEKCHELIEEAISLRTAAHLSQKQVATALGFNSNGNIPLIEKGRSIPGLDKFLRILSVYGYTLKIIPKESRQEKRNAGQ